MTRPAGVLSRTFGLAAALARGAPSAAAIEAAYPPVGAFVEVGGLRVHYIEAGAKDRPSVVLIHGASGNLRDFTYSLVGRLAERFHVIAFDRPGHGYTDRPDDGHIPAAQARVLAAAARRIGVERAFLVGHSYGAAPALAWALDAPDMARGVLSVSGASHPWDGSLSPLYALSLNPLSAWAVRAFAHASVPALVSEIFAPDATPPGYADHVGALLSLRPDTFRNNAHDITRLNAALAAQAPRYAQLRVPVEVIHGDADEIVLLDLSPRRLADDAPDGALTVLKGTGHMPHHAVETEVIAALDRLVARAGVSA